MPRSSFFNSLKSTSSFASLLPFPRPTLLRPLPLLSSSSTPSFTPLVVHARHRSRGTEYQPSQRKLGGRKILERRRFKGRTHLTH
ncbi:hypothetical protein BGW80DRAFT_1314173 [Lactifluus volemus]|nr:hypothetical protein BGW80DRAFT_1314173 [Lactifluus volemus]